MTKEDKSKLIPQELYANAYIETWIDINGVKHEDFRFGNLYKNKEDVPNYYEISCVRARHLGKVKIEIKIENEIKSDRGKVDKHHPTKSMPPICEKPIFQIGDKVQNKQTGYSNIIKHIDGKNYMFVDGIYIFDNEDGFAIKEQNNWRKI